MTDETGKSTMNETPRERKPGRVYPWIILALLPAAVMFALYFYPATKVGPLQPISFSHRVHAGVKEINCRFCHTGVERSWNAALPAVEKCFFCHKYVIPDHPEIKREEQHLRTDTPVPWKRIFWVPDFVYFNHVPHVKWAKLDCTNCHGDVKTFDRLQKVDFQMGFCIDCHRKRGAELDCWLACHR
jgi:hypothetical protein